MDYSTSSAASHGHVTSNDSQQQQGTLQDQAPNMYSVDNQVQYTTETNSVHMPNNTSDSFPKEEVNPQSLESNDIISQAAQNACIANPPGSDSALYLLSNQPPATPKREPTLVIKKIDSELQFSLDADHAGGEIYDVEKSEHVDTHETADMDGENNSNQGDSWVESCDNVQPWLGRWCYICQKSVQPRCKLHRYHHLKDKPVVCRAEMTLPSALKLEKIDPVNQTVVARRPLFPSTLFGPLEGHRVPISQMNMLDFQWLISHDGGLSECLVADNEDETNWLIYLRKTTNIKLANTEAFQHGNEIYFVTTRAIKSGEELLYYYSSGYYHQMSLVLSEDILSQYPHPFQLAKKVSKRSRRKNKPLKMKIRKMDVESESVEDEHEVVLDMDDQPLSLPDSDLGDTTPVPKLNKPGRRRGRGKGKKTKLKKATEEGSGSTTSNFPESEMKPNRQRQSDDFLQLVTPTFVDCEQTNNFPEVRLSKEIKEASAEFRGSRKCLVVTIVTEDPLHPPQQDAIKYPTLSIEQLTSMGLEHDQMPPSKKAKSRPVKKRTQSDAQVSYYSDSSPWLGQQGEHAQGQDYPTFNSDGCSHWMGQGGATGHNVGMGSVEQQRPVYPTMVPDYSHVLPPRQSHASSLSGIEAKSNVQEPNSHSMNTLDRSLHVQSGQHPSYQGTLPKDSFATAPTSLPANVPPSLPSMEKASQQQGGGTESVQSADAQTRKVGDGEGSVQADGDVVKGDTAEPTINKIMAMTKKTVPGFSVYPQSTDVQDSGRKIVYTYADIPDEWRAVYICVDCGRLLKTRKFMFEHVTKHSKDTKYLCDGCGKGFKTTAMLARHKYSVHTTSEQKHTRGTICAHCSKWFADRYKLRRHELTHTGEQYKHFCTICDKKFSATYHLKRHLLTVHHGYRPHICPICKKGFSERKDQKQHVLKVHGAETANFYGITEKDKLFPENNSSAVLPQQSSQTYMLPTHPGHGDGKHAIATPMGMVNDQYAAVNSLLSFY